MQKVTVILVFYLILAGCSATRRAAKTERQGPAIRNGNIMDDVEGQNLTRKDFYIEKAEFTIKDRGKEKSGIGTIKFVRPDKFLISIKSNAGIELVRSYITGDSIKINDRFDKKLFYGSASFLRKKYGVSTAVLPVLLGDYIDETYHDPETVKCWDDNTEIIGRIKNLSVKYVIDCNKGKTVSVVTNSGDNEAAVRIEYQNFVMKDGIFTPRKIIISDNLNDTTVEIKIIKISSPWEGTIEFIPGKQYERILLQ